MALKIVLENFVSITRSFEAGTVVNDATAAQKADIEAYVKTLAPWV